MLGAALQELELSEEEIMKVVFQQSLGTYSKFFPYHYFLNLMPENHVEGTLNTYRFERNDRLEIMQIHKVFVSNMVQMGSTMIPMSYNPFEQQVFNDYVSMTVTPVTWEFKPPYEITIYPKIINYQNASIEVRAKHPEHLKTIPVQMKDEFLKLCLYDVLISLYPL